MPVIAMSLLPEGFKHVVNVLCAPYLFMPIMIALFAIFMAKYRTLTKPPIAAAMALIFAAFYVASMTDPNFMAIISKADNVPITMLIISVGFFTWLAMRQAAINDERMERGLPLIEAGADDKVLVWPDLVFTELICMILCTVFLVVWAIVLKAPLEPPANPAVIPNPSKAPWYFLGLQEMLVYFDPWIAGVLLPGLIVAGLVALPYIDMNPRGNGYYTYKQRKASIWLFLFGFMILWNALIVVGTFLRGPNWNLFGPYEFWDPHRPAALLNINLSDIVWIILPGSLGMEAWKPGLPTEPLFGIIPAYLVREAPGIILLSFYFLVVPVILAKTLLKKFYRDLGIERYIVFWVLLSWTGIMPLKMVLRWLFNMKYFVALTEFFFNI